MLAGEITAAPDRAGAALLALDVPVLVSDQEGCVELANVAAATLLGRTATALAGLPLDLALDGLAPDADDAGGRSGRLTRPDGTAVALRARTVPLGEAGGTLTTLAELAPGAEAGERGPSRAEAVAAMVDAAAEAMIATDADDVVWWFNPAAEELLGWDAEAVVGRPVWDLAADHPTLQSRALRDEVRAGRTVRRETAVRHRDGRRIAVALAARPRADAAGRFEGMVITALDVTGRRTAERDAERTRELLQRVIEQSPSAVWAKDREGRCHFVNREGAKVLGRTAEEVLGRTDAELGLDLANRHRAEDERVLAAGVPITFQRVTEVPGHGPRTMLFTKFPIMGGDGRVDGVGIVASDVTELRRGELDRARLAAIVQAAPDAIVTEDADGRIATWNPGAERILGLRAEEAIGRPYEEVLVPRGERDRHRATRAAMRAHGAVGLRTEARRADGSTFPAEISAAPLAATEHGGGGIVVLVRDVTDLAEAELEARDRAARLERSNADLEGFAFAASHDLQEPLRLVSLGARVVLRSADDRLHHDERRLLADVIGAAGRMGSQVEALMGLARVVLREDDAGGTALRTALDDALSALGVALAEAGALVEAPDALPEVAMPRAELALVLQNLLANAVRFRRPDVPLRVEIGAQRHSDAVVIRVADNGAGIEPADQAKLFGMLARAHEDVPGTGLGLALCRRMLERRFGSIAVQSSGAGCGSCFVVTVPAAGERTP